MPFQSINEVCHEIDLSASRYSFDDGKQQTEATENGPANVTRHSPSKQAKPDPADHHSNPTFYDPRTNESQIRVSPDGWTRCSIGWDFGRILFSLSSHSA